MTPGVLSRRLAALGRSLREIRAEYLREEGGESVRWYQGQAGTDLFAWLAADGSVTRMQLTFARSVVEWELSSGLRTGRMDGGFGGGPGRFDTYLIRTDDSAQLDLLRAARYLLAESEVDPALSAPLLQALERQLGPETPESAPK